MRIPIIWIKDNSTGMIREVGTNHHDRLYLDELGHIQYENLQNGDGTIGGGYEFVLDEEGHNAQNLPYTDEEISKYGLTCSDCWFNMVEPTRYGADKYEEYIKNLEEINERLLQGWMTPSKLKSLVEDDEEDGI